MVRSSSRARLLVGAAVASALGAALPAAAAPAVPTGVTATLVGSPLVVRVGWTDVAGETGYRVERCYGTCSDFGTVVTLGPDVTSWDDPFAPSGTSATYRVVALDAGGASAPSATASVSVISLNAVTARIAAVPVSGTAPLTVSVDGSASSTLNGTVTGWDWAFGDGGTASGATASHTYTTPGVYALGLEATATGGFGPSNGTSQVLVTVTAPPQVLAPTGLVGTSPAKGQASLAWTNPAGSAATQLLVQRCTGSGCTAFATVASVPPTVSAFTNFGLRSKTVYRFRVVATDGRRTAATGAVPVFVR